jgi:hypothetical protein
VTRARLGGRVLLSLVVMAVAAQLFTPVSGHAAPPPLPPQPGSPASPCRSTAGTPLAWRTAYSESSPGTAMPAYALTVDPFASCRMYRATTSDALDRSTDGGRSWTPVFRDTQAGTPDAGCLLACAPGNAFRLSFVGVPGPGMVMLADDGNGDAIVRSDDAGASWHLANSGISGQMVDSVSFGGPSTGVAYAVTRPAGAGYNGSGTLGVGPGAAGLFVTRDGGASWSAARLPPPPPSLARTARGASVQVDPARAGHAFLLYNSPETTNALVETQDYGANWTPVGPVTGSVDQFLVTLTPRHGLRLYVLGATNIGNVPLVSTTGSERLQVSLDGGRTWTPTALPPINTGAVMAADPADQDRMLVVGDDPAADFRTTVLSGFMSTDGFITALPVPRPAGLVNAAIGQRSPLHQPFVQAGNGTAPPEEVIQADTLGNFFVSVMDQPPGGRRQQVLEFTMPTRPKVGLPPGAAPCQGLLTCGDVLTQVGGCLLPTNPLGAGPLFGGSGTIAFDGVDLLLTNPGEKVDDRTGIIHRYLPTPLGPCKSDGDLKVLFDPADLKRMPRNPQRYPGGPAIDELTYDANHDRLFVALDNGYGAGRSNNTQAPVPIFTVTGVPGNPSLATAHLAFIVNANGCGFFSTADPFLSYDATDDTIWSCTPSGQVGHVTATGVEIPTCMTSKLGTNTDAATWVVGAPGRLLVGREDDQTVDEFDARSCTLVRHTSHYQVSESSNEDEQLACDPLTFGPGTVTSTSALWIRDPDLLTITAYAIPGNACPLPTALSLRSPAQISRGSTATFCADLSLRGRARPLPGLPVDLSVGPVDLGAITTDNAGGVCQVAAVSLPAGVYAVTATFAGTGQQLPSTASGSLRVTEEPVLSPASAPPASAPHQAPPAVQARTDPPPTASTQLQAQAQGQAQAQSQAQTQAQGQAQVQPGMMTDEQPEPQVALETAEDGGRARSHLASRRRGVSPALIVSTQLLLVATVALALARRPRHALALVGRGR